MSQELKALLNRTASAVDAVPVTPADSTRALAITLALAGAATAQDVFVLQPVDREVRADIYRDSRVTGVSIRASWAALEPERGVYDWAFLDATVAKCRANGKQFMLRTIPGRRAPDWAVADSDRCKGVPIPWRGDWLARYLSLQNELAARYRNERGLRVVHINGPTRGGEFHLEAGMENLADYDPDELLLLWARTIEAYDLAWSSPGLACPHSFSLNVSRVLPGAGGRLLPEAIVAMGRERFGSRLIVQNNSLHATTNTDWSIYQLVAGEPRYGWQMLSPSSADRFGGEYGEAWAKAGAAEYVEIYQGDL